MSFTTLASLLSLSSGSASSPTLVAPAPGPNMQCRTVLTGISRSSDVRICRSKRAWADYDACNGATRYCSPAQKAAMARNRGETFAMNEDSRIVCRMVKGTGSRLSLSKVCLPQREWQRWWDEASAATFDFQDKSTRVEGQQ